MSRRIRARTKNALKANNSKKCKHSSFISEKITEAIVQSYNVIEENKNSSNILNDTLKMLLSGLFSLLAFGALFGSIAVIIFGSMNVLNINNNTIKVIYFLLMVIVLSFVFVTLVNSKRFRIKEKLKKFNLIEFLTKSRSIKDVPSFILAITVFLSFIFIEDRKSLTSVLYYALYFFGGIVLTLLFFLLSKDVNKEKDKYYIVSFAAVIFAIVAIIIALIK